MPKIKTFEAACKLLKLDPKKVLPDVNSMPQGHQESTLAYSMLVIIAEALNKEANGGQTWKPNWKDNNEWKYYPWFDMSSGSGLSYGDYDYQYSYSSVGSRLCFKTSDLARYAGTQFKSLYEKYFLIT
jgi:hypothetical protein